MPGRDAFEERYTAGVLTEDHAPAEPSPLERGAVAQAMPAASLPMAMIAGSIAYARSDCYMQLTGGAGPEQLPRVWDAR